MLEVNRRRTGGDKPKASAKLGALRVLCVHSSGDWLLMETFDPRIRNSVDTRITTLELSCVAGIGGCVVLDVTERGVPVT